MVEYNRSNSIFDDDDRMIWELTHLSLSFKSMCFNGKPLVTVSSYTFMFSNFGFFKLFVQTLSKLTTW